MEACLASVDQIIENLGNSDNYLIFRNFFDTKSTASKVSSRKAVNVDPVDR